jgi:hypothetical protein
VQLIDQLCHGGDAPLKRTHLQLQEPIRTGKRASLSYSPPVSPDEVMQGLGRGVCKKCDTAGVDVGSWCTVKVSAGIKTPTWRPLSFAHRALAVAELRAAS